jgi:hypothetical protein
MTDLSQSALNTMRELGNFGPTVNPIARELKGYMLDPDGEQGKVYWSAADLRRISADLSEVASWLDQRAMEATLEGEMSQRTVTTQAELDQAIKDKIDWIDIRSTAGVWIEVRAYGQSTVRAYGQSTVTAYDQSTVTAYDQSTVRAYDQSTVTAYGQSTVRAYDQSTVTAYGQSTVRAYGQSTVTAYDQSTVTAYGQSTVTAYGQSTVTAYGQSTVRAYGQSTVTAYGQSTVRAYDQSTVRAYDQSTVTAYGQSTVRAYDQSTVRADDQSTVTAGKGVAVHLHSASVNLSGGVVLDHTKLADLTAKEWCDYYGVEVKRGIATLFKAVNNKWTTSRGFDYSPGSKPSCGDFNDTDSCGGGLHFGPTPWHAKAYFYEATKFVAVGVRVSELRPISDGTAKAKAPRVVRACVEVDIDGNVIAKGAA